MSKVGNWASGEITLAVAAVAWILLLHGAVPFFMTPTLGQAVWTAGFAKSFANGPFLSIYAHDFGLPMPAAIPFGLAGAWSVSWLIRLGLNAADAYAGMAAFWLMLAFCSAYKISRSHEGSRSISILAAVTWMSMPVIWVHAGYSMLSLGIGLLPFYFLAALNLSRLESASGTNWAALHYLVATLISVFMDGYTFVMFATGSSILFGYVFFTDAAKRRNLLTIALPVHFTCFALAYLAFITYVGRNNFDNDSLEFFRGWGLDLSFVVIPTKGVHWLLDVLMLSLDRTNDLYFGDGSVWQTTFSLPIVLAGLFAWWRTRERRSISTGFLIIALFGFFMALGPSLKIDSTKPAHVQAAHPREQSALMPAQFAIGPTGSAWVSETLPGFKSMRASYRWSALGVFALWAIVVTWSGLFNTSPVTPLVTLLLITVLNVPHLPQRFRSLIDNRLQFNQIDEDLLNRFRDNIREGETVAFVPWGNDFIANYLAPRLGFRTFNIGGDKNLMEAQSNWPSAMLALGGELETGKIVDINHMLLDRDADAVVVPYFHMLWAPHLWPCADWTVATLAEETKSNFDRIPGFYCPDRKRNELRPVIEKLKGLAYLEVTDNDFFATIRMRPVFAGDQSRQELLNAAFEHFAFPIEFGAGLTGSSVLLKEGWYPLEQNLVWSRATAKLALPVPKTCHTRQCLAVLHFRSFGASAQRRVSITFEGKNQGVGWNGTVISTADEINQITVPLDAHRAYQEISVVVPEAISPLQATGSADTRVLGIALLRADLL